MEFFQVMIQGVFSLIGAGALFFIAFRAYTVGNDIAEMKDALKSLQRTGGLPTGPIAPISAIPEADAARLLGHEPGDWPSVTDPNYNSELPYGLKPSEQQRSPVTSRPESW